MKIQQHILEKVADGAVTLEHMVTERIENRRNWLTMPLSKDKFGRFCSTPGLGSIPE